jgi:SulP family sulfate permease
MGRLPGTTVFRNLDRFEEAEPVPGVLVLRVDASFYYGNVAFLKETVAKYVAEDASIEHIVIDASAINRLDSSADAALAEIAEDLEARGILLHLAGVKGPVRDTMQRSGLANRLGSRARYLSVDEAVEAAAGGPSGTGTGAGTEAA